MFLAENSVILEKNLAAILGGSRDDYVVHVLCLGGEVRFKNNGIPFSLDAGNCAIFPLPKLVTDIEERPRTSLAVISVTNAFLRECTPQSSYSQGTFSLFMDPVMHLSREQLAVCRRDFDNVKFRLENTGHKFHAESVVLALQLLFLDFFDIHAANTAERGVSPQTAETVNRFLQMLERGDCRKYREISYYAKELCVTGKYLSELCKNASGFAANYWINRFTQMEIRKLLKDRSLTLAQISDKLNFSSPAYFTRYVKNAFGKSPQDLRE